MFTFKVTFSTNNDSINPTAVKSQATPNSNPNSIGHWELTNKEVLCKIVSDPFRPLTIPN
ncbi:hypothetical protein PtA15_12A381 [Puccinia triticina]|uniref:Uncharacterized protein n=1 Tax=Puccinia triticina TaxID=208348 RepID=A0ABY7D297_9BASI|nr:uncharacterized protein PtA15_12A381 [Puccinia triticina]WAQ90392.1 hypothetical protein PtA15_12A381 [Puccinia triticina]WAR61707.1 hypothetical protein PtB15_12B397 [Puccinia triticina]